MTVTEEQADAVDEELRHWRQGDVSCDVGLEFMHLADLSRPHSPVSLEANTEGDDETRTIGVTTVAEEVAGVVVLTQTCDIVRSCWDRPYVEVAPLVKLDDDLVDQVRRLKRSAFAHISATAEHGLVADLDRIMTVEKAVVANWTRIPGWQTDAESREFARAIARKRSRFAFPDDFVSAADRFRRRLTEKHNRASPEGGHLRALREIRVRAAPSWHADDVELTIWFIKDHDPGDGNSDWSGQVESWIELFDQSGRFRVVSRIACRLDDITARDYVESDELDFDSLSVDRAHR